MKTKYRMSDDEYNAIIEIARNPSPVMYTSGGAPLFWSTQERANAVWQAMASRLGFVWDTAEDAGTGDPKDFLASPRST